MDVRAYESKLKKVLERFSQPKFIITDNYNVDNLLSHLSGKNDQVLGEKLLKSPVVTDWILTMLEDKTFFVESVSCSVKVFILRLIALILENENQFTKLSFKGVFSIVTKSVESGAEMDSPSIKHGYLKMLQALTKYSMGICWIIKCNGWRYALRAYTQNNTVYVTKAASEFLVSYVWRLNDMDDEKQLGEVIQEIIKPVCENPWKEAEVITSDQDNEMDQYLTPTIKLLIDIESNPKYIGRGSAMVRILYGHCSVDLYLWNLFFICRNENLLRNFAKLAFMSTFAKVNINKRDGEEMSKEDIFKCSLANFNLIHILIRKRMIDVVVDLTVFCHKYINNICDRLPFNEIGNNGKVFSVRNQLLILPLIPIMCSVKTIKDNDQEILQLYIHKLLSISCEQTTRMAYAFRDCMKEKPSDYRVVKVINNIISLKDHLTSSQANIIFQTLYYRIKDFVPSPETAQSSILSNNLETAESLAIMNSLLDAIYCLIEKYDINWHESVEVIGIFYLSAKILKMSNLGSNIMVKTLRVMGLTIKKFLVPSLALLVDTPKGSSLGELGSLIYTKLHDHNWDVRDSALEVLLACTELALVKYPPFQAQILDHNLGPLVATLAINDSESYVRVSALKCLGAMSRIQALWEHCLGAHPGLHSEVMKIVHSESEGIIRKEAAAVLNDVYEHQKFPNNLYDQLLLSMAYAATEDIHWEVQLMALQFWRNFIYRQFSNQGMIDGKFPAVTFSNNRKIVTLNADEIRKRVKKVVSELSAKGCLGVLLFCLSEETDVEVMEFNYTIVKGLKSILEQYEVEFEVDPDAEMGIKSADTTRLDFAKTEVDIEKSSLDINKSDLVIDAILNANDINLLANVCQNQLHVKEESETTDICKSVIGHFKRMLVDPGNFLQIVNSTDYEKLIEAKKIWLSGSNSLHSLLDDILGEYHPSGVNDMDCY